jgi:hypothetical protein
MSYMYALCTVAILATRAWGLTGSRAPPRAGGAAWAAAPKAEAAGAATNANNIIGYQRYTTDCIALRPRTSSASKGQTHVLVSRLRQALLDCSARRPRTTSALKGQTHVLVSRLRQASGGCHRLRVHRRQAGAWRTMEERAGLRPKHGQPPPQMELRLLPPAARSLGGVRPKHGQPPPQMGQRPLPPAARSTSPSRTLRSGSGAPRRRPSPLPATQLASPLQSRTSRASSSLRTSRG